MKKIPTLFERDWDGDRSRVLNVVNPEAAWLLELRPPAVRTTTKVDGTACLVQGGALYARYMLREGRPAPEGFVAADEMADGKQPGWRPVGEGPEDRYHREAYVGGLPDGTYELIGPRVQGNPYGEKSHFLISHERGLKQDWVEPTWDEVRAVLERENIEGLVWHEIVNGGVGRMVKIKRRDFGLPWPVKESKE